MVRSKNLREKKKPDRDEKEWLIFFAKFLYIKKVDNIIILHLNKENYVVDYFIIGTVKTAEHANSIVNDLKRVSKELGSKITNVEGQGETGWTIIQWGFCAIHLFTQELRSYYNIEDLWIDAKKISWKNARLTLLPHPKKFVSASL